MTGDLPAWYWTSSTARWVVDLVVCAHAVTARGSPLYMACSRVKSVAVPTVKGADIGEWGVKLRAITRSTTSNNVQLEHTDPL